MAEEGEESGFPVLGMAGDGVVDGGMGSSLGEWVEGLGLRSGMVPIWTVEISQ